jgi:apolipoprotein D and lipocalin family protein
MRPPVRTRSIAGLAALGLGLGAAVGLALTARAGTPKGIEPVSGFDSARYLGKWYEIARLDHRFERGLSRVTAEYARREDGAIRVLNRGFNQAKGKWKENEGKASFVEGPDVGFLKVSFFGPFYGSYVITELDPDYRHALVTGNDRSYLWLLARTPTLDEPTKKRLLQKAQALGFDTSKLLWVEQSAGEAAALTPN